MTTCNQTHEANDYHLILVECDFCPMSWAYECRDIEEQKLCQASWIEHLREHQVSTGKLDDLDLTNYSSRMPGRSVRDMRHWKNGYQEALFDIAQKLRLGGAEEAAEWILNNKTPDWG